MHPRRDYWANRIAELDPSTEFGEIVRIVTSHEFPWDLRQALGLALLRTYAVPEIGQLLAQTKEFTERTQKRYDDTALILATISENGFDTSLATSAIRRMNQMHAAYDISTDNLRYVLASFVVVPKRWLDDFGWRPLTEAEITASTSYYRALGRHMGIREIPETFADFAALLDGYEAEHFGYTVGARAVADATLKLLATFQPRVVRRFVDVFSRSLMDQPLLDALGLAAPCPLVVRLSRGALKARARLMRFAPPRMNPLLVKDLDEIRTYPGGFDVNKLGTFASSTNGCPVPKPSSR